jgi:hypothetical protein
MTPSGATEILDLELHKIEWNLGPDIHRLFPTAIIKMSIFDQSCRYL